MKLRAVHFVFFFIFSHTTQADNFPVTEAANVITLTDTNQVASATINAIDKFWRSSGVLLEQGNQYLINASGQWLLGALCNPTGPDGISPYTIACWDVGVKTVQDVSHSSLIGKIGHDGVPFYIGAVKDLQPIETGILYFMVNDHPDWFFDNSGSVQVTTRLINRAQTAPAAPVTETTEIIIKQETPDNTNTIQIKRGGGGGGGGRAPK